MNKMQRVMIFLGLVATQAKAEPFVRKHQTGQVVADDMESGTKHQKRYVVDANGNVEVDAHLADMTSRLSLSFVRKHQGSASKPSSSHARSTSELGQITVDPHGTPDMDAVGSMATFQSNAGLDLVTAKDRIDDLSFCTLFDGKDGAELSASLRNEVVLPHLTATSHAAENLVFFDCTEETNDVFQHLYEMQVSHGFKLACVNKSIKARAEWSQLWIEEPEIAMEQWPLEYTGTLRLALHQCLSTCQTRYCAWADGDIMIFPATSMGWAPGSRQCLIDAAKMQSSQHPPVFFSPGWYSDEISVDTMPSRMHFTNAYFREFSSQVFVVDKPALHKWLPIPSAALRYHEDINLQGKFQRLRLPKLRDEVLSSAIERLVVAKSTYEYAECLEKGFACSAIVNCDPQPATKVHLNDWKRDTLQRYGADLTFEFNEIDKDLTSVSRMTQLAAPPSAIDRQLSEVQRLRKLAIDVLTRFNSPDEPAL